MTRDTASCAFFFFAMGLVYAEIMARMPAIKENLAIDDAAVGFAMLCLGIGSLLGLVFCGKIVQRFSSRRVLQIASVVMFLATPFLGLLTNWLLFCLTFIFLGLSFGLVDVCMNTQAILHERIVRQNSMGLMQASYSAGGISGACIGFFFAWLGLGPGWNFVTTSFAGLLLWTKASAHLHDDLPRKESKRIKRGIPFFIFFCGIIELCTFATEGAISDWGSILMHDAKGASEGFAAASLAACSLPMFIMRLLSDRLRTSFGDVPFLLGGSLLAAIGLILCIWTSSAWLCVLGFFCVGLGAAPIIPILMSRVGNYPNIDPSIACSVVSSIGYAGLLVLPPLLGSVSKSWGIETALCVPLGLCLCVVVGSFTFVKK